MGVRVCVCVRVTERDGKGDGRDGERAQKDSCEISHREEDERGGGSRTIKVKAEIKQKE